uniref:Putative secreted protein n=1 Tax=Amblyomma triste TaxID=251400 RepID=A0A023G4X6_AMBTT
MKLTYCLALIFLATDDHISTVASYGTKERCTAPYRGGGYGKAYNYKCKLRNVNYPPGTPCLPLDYGGRINDRPGLCVSGTCKPHYDLDDRKQVCVFPQSLNKCPEKPHTSKNVLEFCTYTCKKNNKWYFGYYQSHDRSTCLLPGTTNKLGSCCYGLCVPRGTPCAVPN